MTRQITVTVINEKGTYKSKPFLLPDEQAKAVKDNLDQNKLSALTFPLETGGDLTVSRYWIEKSMIIWQETSPEMHVKPQEPVSSPPPGIEGP